MFVAFLALLASIATLAVPQVDVRVMRHPNTRSHLLRITYDVEISHVRGTQIALYDIDDGRFVERTTTGPISSAQGFDGLRSWAADRTGVTTIEDHPDDVIDERAWAHFLGRRGPERPQIRALREGDGTRTWRLSFVHLSGPIDVTVSQATGYPVAIVDRSGIEASVDRYTDYRNVRGFLIPFHEAESTRFVKATSSVRRVEVLSAISDRAFDPPPRHDDFTLDRATTLPMALGTGGPVISVRIDGGPPMRMLFDSGGAYSLTSHAARRLGLRLFGSDAAGGIGAGVDLERYAMVRSVRIGGATLRDQLIPVLDSPGDDTDGAIGCQVLQRFSVRFDFIRKRVTLARDVSELGVEDETAIPMRLNGCTPEIDGTFEHRAGAFGIDTGSASLLDVMAPYVRAHGLLKRYHTKSRKEVDAPGGAYFSAPFVASSLELGDYEWSHFDASLSTMNAGAFDDPTEIGNVGVPALDRMIVVFDYRHRRMWMFR